MRATVRRCQATRVCVLGELCREGREECVLALLAHGGSVNAATLNRRTPLHWYGMDCGYQDVTAAGVA